MNLTFWPPERCAELLRWRDFRTLTGRWLRNAEIAAEMGIAEHAVKHGVHLCGCPRRQRTPAGGPRFQPTLPRWCGKRLEELAGLLSERPVLTFTEIGRRLGCSKGAVIGAAHRHLLDEVEARQRLREPEPPAPMPVLQFPSSGECNWPLGNPGEPDFHFCCAGALRGSVYCTEHHLRAFLRAA